jgi:hypothetical protein
VHLDADAERTSRRDQPCFGAIDSTHEEDAHGVTEFVMANIVSIITDIVKGRPDEGARASAAATRREMDAWRSVSIDCSPP